MLPNGKVLTIDVGGGTNTEIYDPATDTWISAGSTGVGNSLSENVLYEIGAAVLRPDGTVFAIGSTGTSAIYNSSSGVWKVGPALPTSPLGYQCTQQDGGASLLRNGNILLTCSGGTPSPGSYQSGPSFWYEFDYQTSKVK